MATRGPRVSRFILNCDRSTDVQSDWTFEDAVEAGVGGGRQRRAAGRSETRARPAPASGSPPPTACSTGTTATRVRIDGLLGGYRRRVPLSVRVCSGAAAVSLRLPSRATFKEESSW